MSIAWMDPAKIDNITIHCAATPEGRNFTAEQIKAVGMQRFGQPSYHYYYDLEGNETQLLRHDQRGAHVAGGNTGNIGMCYGGGLARDGKTPKDTRTPGQKAAMERRLKQLKQQYPNAHVKGHTDHPNVNKACPSFDVAAWLREIGVVSGPSGKPAQPSPPPASNPAREIVREIQVALNKGVAAGLIAVARLDEDGLPGPKTKAALAALKL